MLREAGRLDVRALAAAGATLVVAPHPDDESLGCAGLIALLVRAGAAVWALLVTDGAASHPGSRRFDRAARVALRDAEWQAALDVLGVARRRRRRLGLPDGALPAADSPAFELAAQRLAAVLEEARPAVLVVPWRRDPHRDHRATHALAVRALALAGYGAVRRLEYPVWLDERGADADRPADGEARALRLDIASVRDAKRAAIAAHRSQCGEVIDDDPGGFRLDAAMRERAVAGDEIYLEAR